MKEIVVSMLEIIAVVLINWDKFASVALLYLILREVKAVRAK